MANANLEALIDQFDTLKEWDVIMLQEAFCDAATQMTKLSRGHKLFTFRCGIKWSPAIIVHA
eukprot:2197085-Alexandrium_andersonii.AAC.1